MRRILAGVGLFVALGLTGGAAGVQAAGAIPSCSACHGPSIAAAAAMVTTYHDGALKLDTYFDAALNLDTYFDAALGLDTYFDAALGLTR